ncbi:MAG TPA: right-handed parallel beta-helix repeat-containing protein [Streptosporangiaceae bacterium]|nr:right-handed parallel beta-helix repeat-containing protein [Streptosporangiaceae bacterium]
MSRRNRRQNSRAKAGRSWLAALAALCVFGLLVGTPVILKALHIHLQPVAATWSHGVALLQPPRNPHAVPLPPVARAIDPGQPPALLPVADPAREAALVTAEDNRIRVLLHLAVRIYQPEVLPVRGSLPTVVLTPRKRPYTSADLAQYGALVRLPHGAGLLLDNVYVAAHATLSLGAPHLQALYMDSSGGGFASIVAWGGNLSFQGTASQPFTIIGWDRATKTPAQDRGDGRAYIREVGGKMTFTDARVSALGFWSGRTGGVAWTGLSGQPSSGGASSSTFTDDTYGAFVARGQGVSLTGDLFEYNQLDGVHVHRYSVGTSVDSSSAVRNGLNGMMVDRATQATLLRGDTSQHNVRNGFFVDGRPLVSGASASGSSVAPGSGATIEDSSASGNGRTGILVEGGTGTVLKADQVCAAITGIAVRYGATNSVLTGNDIDCSPRSGLSLGPVAPGTMVSGNTIENPRIGILVRNSGREEIDNNLISGATIFGISARGLGSRVSGVSNAIAGNGFRPVDFRAQANPPALTRTDTSAWAHHAKITFFSYLLFHPLAALWLSIVVLVVLMFLWSRRRRLPPHPYPASTHWRWVPPDPEPLPVPAAGHPERVFAGAVATRPRPAGLDTGPGRNGSRHRTGPAPAYQPALAHQPAPATAPMPAIQIPPAAPEPEPAVPAPATPATRSVATPAPAAAAVSFPLETPAPAMPARAPAFPAAAPVSPVQPFAPEPAEPRSRPPWADEPQPPGSPPWDLIPPDDPPPHPLTHMADWS